MIDERDSSTGETWIGEEAGVPVASGICHSIIWMSHLIERYANARLPPKGSNRRGDSSI